MIAHGRDGTLCVLWRPVTFESEQESASFPRSGLMCSLVRVDASRERTGCLNSEGTFVETLTPPMFASLANLGLTHDTQ